MPYLKKTYITGRVIETEKYVPRQYMKGVTRAPKRKRTDKEMDDNNIRIATDKLRRKVNTNFQSGDLHITLTYRREERPNPEGAKKIIDDFITELRKEYKKLGAVLKWILVTEQPEKNIHHHMIINEIPEECYQGKGAMRLVQQTWRYGRPKAVPLDDDGSYGKLVDYLLKETRETMKCPAIKQRYTCSRNLIIPEPEKRLYMYRTWREDQSR